MKLQRRPAFGWGPSGAGFANPTRGMAVHYEGRDTGIALWKHSQCIDHWQDTRRFHMGPSRRWDDVGYSFAVCPHYVLEGRGKDRVQAAQPGGNTTWYSCTFMTGPGEEPHPNQIINFRQLRIWLMKDDVDRFVRPHSSFVNTGCPGNKLRNMISDGSLIKGNVKGVESMGDIFCNQGDEGQAVGRLQIRLKRLGFYDGDVDLDYGDKTAKAVLAMRKSQGSGVKKGTFFDDWADWQLETALHERYFVSNNTPEQPGEGISLPLEATISGRVKLT